MNREKEFIGTFDLNNKVDITDPCYSRDCNGIKTVECEPGEYFGYAFINDEGDWGKRVAAIGIFKNDAEYDVSEMEHIGYIGVDAGLAGFFRDKPDFPDEKWMEFLKESGVFKNNDEYDYSKKTYTIPYGVFSESGYGDGSYDVYATPERDAFMIMFLIDDEEV